MSLHRIAPWLLLAAAAPTFANDERADLAATGAIAIYRCVDDRGRLVALRDSPCPKGEHQETVQMQRPRDPAPQPPPAARASTPAAADPPVHEIRVVTVQPPQPMYECTTPDGERYTSDSGEGNPRWIPAWSFAQPAAVWPRPPHVRPPPVRPSPIPPPGGVAPPVTGPHPPRPPLVAVQGGSWIRDACLRLPQQEVCRSLSDRRFEILRTYHAAMPSGRAELDREQARIDARMANDCPGF